MDAVIAAYPWSPSVRADVKITATYGGSGVSAKGWLTMGPRVAYPCLPEHVDALIRRLARIVPVTVIGSVIGSVDRRCVTSRSLSPTPDMVQHP